MPFSRPLVALSMTEADAGLLNYVSEVARIAPCEQVGFVHVATAGVIGDSGSRAELQARIESLVPPHVQTKTALDFDVVVGPRLDSIVKVAIEQRSDVILLGHRPSHAGRRSLARRLAMIAPCSVWLVPDGSPATIRRILVPVDFSDHSADAVSTATRVAAAAGLAKCLALHVYFDQSTVRYDEHIHEVQGEEEALFERFLTQVDRHCVSIEPLLEESAHVPEAILRVAKSRDADLIVMNTRGRSRAAGVLLGSVTSDTLAATDVPLLAVKHFGSRMSFLDALLNDEFWHKGQVKTN